MSSTPSPAHAPSPQPASKYKLPIYDEPSEEIVLIKTELPLQSQVRAVRTEVQNLRQHLSAQTQQSLDRWLEVEKGVSKRINSLVDWREANPTAALYVGIGALTGSILARNRSFPFRFLSPLAFFLGSFAHFMPQTSRNVKQYGFEIQDRRFPNSARLRDEALARATDSVEWMRALKQRVWTNTEKVVRNGSEAVERLSGLKVDSGRRS